MATIGYATLQVIPSMQGVEQNLTGLVGGPAATAGTAAGGSFTSGFSNALKIGAVTVAAATAVGVGLYKVGGVFDDVTDTIRTTTGAQGEALDGLVDSVKNVGATVPAEFSQIGPVVADLNQRLGLSGKTLETVASQYLEAGRVLGEEVDVTATSGAFSAFRIEGEAVSGALDTLFQVGQATGVGINELAGIVQSAGPAMQNLGFSFEETAALAGTLDKAGIDSSRTLASMSKGLVTLARDGEEPQEAFRRVTGELQGLVAEGKTAEALDLASTIFGTKGASQFVGAVQSGVLNLDDLVGSAGLSGDAILDVGKDTADLAEQFQIFKNQGLIAIEPVATSLFSALGSGMAFMNTTGTPALQAFASVAADQLGPAFATAGQFLTGTLVPGLVSAGTWFASNGPTIAAVAAIIGTVLLPVFASLAVSATTSGAATVASFVATRVAAVQSSAAQVAAHYRTVAGWVASGAAAVVSGAQTVAIWTLYRVEAIKGAAASALAHAQVAAGWVASGAVAVAQGAITAGAWVASSARTAGAVAVQTGAMVAQRAVMVAGAAATGVVTAAQWAWNAALTANPIGIVVVAIALLVGALVLAWQHSETFRAVVTGAWDGVKAAVSAVGTWLTTTVPAWWAGIVSDTRAKWDSVVGVFTSVRSRVSDAVQQVLGVVKTVFGFTPLGLVVNNFDAIVGFFRGIPGKISDALAAAPGMLRDAGARIIGGLADGITGAVGKVTGAVSNVMARVRDFLPFSPAKKGPFSGRGWSFFSGQSITSDTARGMLSNRDKLTNASASLMAAAAFGPVTDGAELLSWRPPAPPAAPGVDEVALRRGDDNEGAIVIHGNVGWTLEEVEEQRKKRLRRRVAVRGLRSTAAGV